MTRERRVDLGSGQALDTVNSYDAQGRLVSTDGPLPGTADATYARYDVHGRRTWEIGAADPAGVRLATRSQYRDSDDKLVSAERGTIPDSDSSSLTVLNRTDLAYDSRRNPERETLFAEGIAYALTQRSFDDRNQLVCEARRMYPPQVPADACVPGVEGPTGPDRITRNVWDAAGQRLQLREGVGSCAISYD